MKTTRYFTLTRVDPGIDDYLRMLKSCERIRGSLFYKTIWDGVHYRLLGVIVLCGRSTSPGDLASFFPNFLVARLPVKYDDGFEWLVDSIQHYTDGPTFHNYIDHPWKVVKSVLF